MNILFNLLWINPFVNENKKVDILDADALAPFCVFGISAKQYGLCGIDKLIFVGKKLKLISHLSGVNL